MLIEKHEYIVRGHKFIFEVSALRSTFVCILTRVDSLDDEEIIIDSLVSPELYVVWDFIEEQSAEMRLQSTEVMGYETLSQRECLLRLN